MKYPDDMDAECIPLCDALNALPGINTIQSCCGHGKYKFRVFFTANNLESLDPISKAIHGMHWSCYVYGRLNANLTFCLESWGVTAIVQETSELVLRLTRP